MRSTTLIMLEEQLKWAYQGSMHLNGRIDWGKVNILRAQIKEMTMTEQKYRYTLSWTYDGDGGYILRNRNPGSRFDGEEVGFWSDLSEAKQYLHDANIFDQTDIRCVLAS